MMLPLRFGTVSGLELLAMVSPLRSMSSHQLGSVSGLELISDGVTSPVWVFISSFAMWLEVFEPLTAPVISSPAYRKVVSGIIFPSTRDCNFVLIMTT